MAKTALKIAFTLVNLGFPTLAEPIQLACHMDACSWANIEIIKELENGKDGGVLYEISYIFGSSNHKNGTSYPKSYTSNIPIKWKKNSKKIMVYCSYIKPALFEKKSSIKTFEFPNVYGYEMSALSLYMHTCHRSPYNGNNETFKNLGYKKITHKKINSIEELLK